MPSMTGMRKSGNFLRYFLPLLMILGMVQVLAAQGLAHNPTNDEDSPVKSGYAVITSSVVGPATDTPNGLVVFITFGQHRGQDAAQAGVLPASLSTDFLLFVSTSGRLSRNLGVAIANPGENTAHLTLTLLDEEGHDLLPPAADAITLYPGHQTSRFVTEIFDTHPLPRDFTGTLRINSDEPVAVIGLRFRGINFSTIPATPIEPISSLADGAVILPQFATGGGWASEIILINSGTAELDVRVDLFDKDGGTSLEAVLNGVTGHTFDHHNLPELTIPPGGVVVLSQRDKNGDSVF